MGEQKAIPRDLTNSGEVILPGSGTWSLFRYYWRFKWLQLRNMLLRLDSTGRLKLFSIVLVGLAFALGAYVVFMQLLGVIMKFEELGELREVLLVRLMNLVTMVFMLMLVYSNLVSTISTMYLGRDLNLLMNTPIPPTFLFRSKVIEVFANSSWMLMAFGIPIFGAYGSTLGAEMLFWPILVSGLFLYLLIPLGVGITATILMVRFFPVKRIHQFMVLSGLFFSIGLIIVLVLMKPQELINPVRPEVLTNYIEDLRVPSASYLPSTWLTEAFMAGINGQVNLAGRYMLLLFAGAGFSLTMALMFGEMYFYDTWTEAQDSQSSRGSNDSVLYRLTLGALRPILSNMQLRLFEKDLKIFFRDTRMWSQIFIIGAIVVIYLFNFAQATELIGFYKVMLNYAGLGSIAFIMAIVASRFAFPVVSMEGRGFWVLKVSPMGFRGYLWERLLFVLIPSIVIAAALMFASNQIIGLDIYQNILTIVTAIVMTVSFNCIAIGFGARYLRFDTDNPAEMLVSLGGFWFMLQSILLAMATMGLVGTPDMIRFIHNTIPLSPDWYNFLTAFHAYDYLVANSAALLLNVAVSWRHFSKGWRYLDSMTF